MYGQYGNYNYNRGGIVVAAVAKAVAMEEDVVDGIPTTPLLKIITASYHSSLP